LEVCFFAISGFPLQNVIGSSEPVLLYRRPMLCRLVEVSLEEWISTGPCERPLVRPVAAKKKSSGNSPPLSVSLAISQ
jgi:hypothetical protein